MRCSLATTLGWLPDTTFVVPTTLQAAERLKFLSSRGTLRAEESLILLNLKPGEIPRFTRNDKIIYFFRSRSRHEMSTFQSMSEKRNPNRRKKNELQREARLDIDDAAFRGDGYGVGAIFSAELRENASHMSFDGVL